MKDIKVAMRLIREYGNDMWMKQIRRNIFDKFGVNLGKDGDSSMSDETDGGPINVSFKYDPEKPDRLIWNCNFTFGQNESSYICTASDNPPTSINGKVIRPIQDGIKDATMEAKQKIFNNKKI